MGGQEVPKEEVTFEEETYRLQKGWQAKLAELQQLRLHFKSERAAGREPPENMVVYEHHLANEVGKMRREFTKKRAIYGLMMHAERQARAMQKTQMIDTVDELLAIPYVFGYSPNN